MAVDKGNAQAQLLDEINRHSTRCFKCLHDACIEWDVNWNHWNIDSGFTVEDDMVHCACGHAIQYEFSIVNKINGNEITPIGSCCIQRFENKEFNAAINMAKRLSRLRDKIRSGEKIMGSKEFSRSTLNWLFDNDIITEDELSIIKAVKKARKQGETPTRRQFEACRIIYANKIKPALMRFEMIQDSEVK